VLTTTPQGVGFATPLHRNFFFRLAFPGITKRPVDKIKQSGIDNWLLVVLSTFRPDRLGDKQSHGVISKKQKLAAGKQTKKAKKKENGCKKASFPKEALFQHELWRGASLSLPPDCRIACEVSQNPTGSVVIRDELDFWVDDELRWGVELLVHGRKKGEHVKRFEADGKYSKLEPQRARVVDFRPFRSRPRGEAKNYVGVLVDADFRGCSVVFQSGKQVRVPFKGLLTAEFDKDGPVGTVEKTATDDSDDSECEPSEGKMEDEDEDDAEFSES